MANDQLNFEAAVVVN